MKPLLVEVVAQRTAQPAAHMALGPVARHKVEARVDTA
jgi:hypothetical protein